LKDFENIGEIFSVVDAESLREGKRNALRMVYSKTGKRNLINLPPSTCKTSWNQ
jgi:hypothetical protein